MRLQRLICTLSYYSLPAFDELLKKETWSRKSCKHVAAKHQSRSYFMPFIFNLTRKPNEFRKICNCNRTQEDMHSCQIYVPKAMRVRSVSGVGYLTEFTAHRAVWLVSDTKYKFQLCQSWWLSDFIYHTMNVYWFWEQELTRQWIRISIWESKCVWEHDLQFAENVLNMDAIICRGHESEKSNTMELQTMALFK